MQHHQQRQHDADHQQVNEWVSENDSKVCEVLFSLDSFKCRSVVGFICADWAHLAAFASPLHLTRTKQVLSWGYF